MGMEAKCEEVRTLGLGLGEDWRARIESITERKVRFKAYRLVWRPRGRSNETYEVGGQLKRSNESPG